MSALIIIKYSLYIVGAMFIATGVVNKIKKGGKKA